MRNTKTLTVSNLLHRFLPNFAQSKDYQVDFAGSLIPYPTNPRRRTAAILKISKNRDISAMIAPIFTIFAPNDVFSQPQIPFGGFIVTAPHLGGKKPQNPNFGGLNRRFQAKLAK